MRHYSITALPASAAADTGIKSTGAHTLLKHSLHNALVNSTGTSTSSTTIRHHRGDILIAERHKRTLSTMTAYTAADTYTLTHHSSILPPRHALAAN